MSLLASGRNVIMGPPPELPPIGEAVPTGDPLPLLDPPPEDVISPEPASSTKSSDAPSFFAQLAAITMVETSTKRGT